jgi:hypothetical protein
MATFIYNNGCGNMQDETGKDIIQMDMDVDEVMYPIESVTNYSEYLDVSLPKPLKTTKIKKRKTMNPSKMMFRKRSPVMYRTSTTKIRKKSSFFIWCMRKG